MTVGFQGTENFYHKNLLSFLFLITAIYNQTFVSPSLCITDFKVQKTNLPSLKVFIGHRSEEHFISGYTRTIF